MANNVSEVSKSRSTERTASEKGAKANKRTLAAPFGKESIRRKKLDPQYVVGFIDGEGSFSISIGKHKTLKRGIEVRPEFEIEVRADDREILERICVTIGCGRIYDCSYERYGWYPHSKYKVTSTRDMEEILFPFLDAHKLQAKKAKAYALFREIVLSYRHKKHLTDAGFNRILKKRDELRALGKKARTYGNR